MLTQPDAGPTPRSQNERTVSAFDMVMTVRDGRISLNTLSPDGSRNLGEFANAAEAWAALDQIDCPT